MGWKDKFQDKFKIRFPWESDESFERRKKRERVIAKELTEFLNDFSISRQIDRRNKDDDRFW